MIANHPFSSILPAFTSCADRYCLGGYGGGGKDMKEILEMADKVEGLEGLELVGNWHVNDENIREVSRMFKDHGKLITMLVPDLWTQAKWGKGSFASVDPAVRQAGIDETKKVMDWAAEIGCPYVDLWFGQDGYDYSFQADFAEARKWLRQGLAAVQDYNPAVKVLVEYKQREPRTHCFVSNAATTLLLLEGLPRIGVLIDLGHSLAAGENMAEAVSLLSSYGKLEYVHLNDNYRTWDDDMIVGSVHLVEYLELVYWLKKVDYKGWLTLDIFPYREDKLKAVIQCKKWMETFFAAVDRIGMDAFAKVIASGDAMDAMDLVRQALCAEVPVLAHV